MVTPYKCTRCGLANAMGSTHCQACGASLLTPRPQQVSMPTVKAGKTGGTSLSTQATTSGILRIFSLREFLGWKELEGQVIHVEPHYMARPDFSWGGFITKLTILGLSLAIFGPIVLGAVVVMMVISLILSIVSPFGGRRGPGFLSSIASQVVGFFLTSKLIGPKADVSVRDARLRDNLGQEHSIRIKGEMIAGNINAGDEVIIEGYDRGGTLMVRHGWNKRTRAEIKVKRR